MSGVFPEPDKDPVIQIANMVVRQGEHAPFIRNVFTLNTCAPVIGSHVLSYMSEKELLAVSNKTNRLAHMTYRLAHISTKIFEVEC